MTTIDHTRPLVTIINVHVCKPEHQQELCDLLLEGARSVYRGLPGFVSASVHKSLDGARVTNYAQYESREAVEAAWQNPAIKPFLERVGALVESFDAHLYEVVEVVGPSQNAS